MVTTQTKIFLTILSVGLFLCSIQNKGCADSVDQDYQQKLQAINKEFAYLKDRNDILRLGDQATATGDRAVFKKLSAIYEITTDEDTKTIALSEMRRVKNYFEIMINKQKVEVTYNDHGTPKHLREQMIPTELLLSGLKAAPSWEYRARIAELLKNRKEIGVPEALLDAILNDQHLEVREKAWESFEAVTGFSGADVLTDNAIQQWWKENADNVQKGLAPLELADKPEPPAEAAEAEKAPEPEKAKDAENNKETEKK